MSCSFPSALTMLHTRKEQKNNPKSNYKLHFIYFFFLLEKCFGFSEEKLIPILQTVFHQINKNFSLKGSLYSSSYHFAFCSGTTFVWNMLRYCMSYAVMSVLPTQAEGYNPPKPGWGMCCGQANIFTQKIANKRFCRLLSLLHPHLNRDLEELKVQFLQQSQVGD